MTFAYLVEPRHLSTNDIQLSTESKDIIKSLISLPLIVDTSEDSYKKLCNLYDTVIQIRDFQEVDPPFTKLQLENDHYFGIKRVRGELGQLLIDSTVCTYKKIADQVRLGTSITLTDLCLLEAALKSFLIHILLKAEK
jgi:hypothetical protein